jgi:hypothetical protein
MLVLEIAQNSVESNVIAASIKTDGGWTFLDRKTNKMVESPKVTKCVLLFDRMLDMWPNCSVEVEGPGQQTSPPWGYCWYSAESWPNVYKENWDTSD